jgi:signal transduction histidine kinase
MGFSKRIRSAVTQKELFLFVGFYVISAFIYYTATWISYSSFEAVPPSYFNLEEFFAAAGSQFIICFLLTLPIWYLISISLRNYSLLVKLISHIFFLPLFVAASYYMQVWVAAKFGWALFWGGYKAVWILYNLLLFYLVQFGFIHAYNYFKRFKQEEQEKAALREIALKSEMIALKAQLNPHFLHNLFNSINASISPENEKTRELIVSLSDLFRYQNYASQQEYVSLREEIGFIEKYLQLMKVRLKERLNFQIEVPEELGDLPIPPMLLHPLVENAVTHGISESISPSILIIRVQKKAQRIVISIEDTGVGIKDKELALVHGIGLSNTQRRLKKLYQSGLNIDDNFPTGTKISFML